MSLGSSLSMVFLWKSIQNVEVFSPLDFGKVSKFYGNTYLLYQFLEDILKAYVISFGKSWEKSLPFVEFAYNNSFQSSLGMAPFEFLYGRKCRTHLNWSETGER